jgi:hypothetical protein
VKEDAFKHYLKSMKLSQINIRTLISDARGLARDLEDLDESYDEDQFTWMRLFVQNITKEESERLRNRAKEKGLKHRNIASSRHSYLQVLKRYSEFRQFELMTAKGRNSAAQLEDRNGAPIRGPLLSPSPPSHCLVAQTLPSSLLARSSS